MTGAKGDQGVQGMAGAKGDQGVQGMTGGQGIQGMNGAKGDQGLQGDSGLCGADESLMGGAKTARCARINTDSLDATDVNFENATITGTLDATSVTVSSLELKDENGSLLMNAGGTHLSVGNSSITATNDSARISVLAETQVGTVVNEIVIDQTGAKISGTTAFLVDSTGRQRVSVDANRSTVESSNEARVVVHSPEGNTTGLVVEAGSTTLSGGGSDQVTIRLDGDGVTLQRLQPAKASPSSLAAAPSTLGAPVQMHNVANGTDAFDAVNKSQLDAMYQASSNQNQATRDEAFRGIAIGNAMEVFLPDPGRNFRLNFGMGFYKDQAALGLTGSGRFGEDVGLYFGVGSDTSFEDVGGKAGVSLQW
jgi:hypothetical protein